MKEEEWRAALEKIISTNRKEERRFRVNVIINMIENLECKKRLEMSILVGIQTRIDILRKMHLVAEEVIGGGDKV